MLDKIKDFYIRFQNDRMLSNSIFLMISTFVMSATGFVFWLINTKIYNPEQIGLATTFISITTLIISFSMVGLNVAIVRFLPRSQNKNNLINTSFSSILLVTFVFSCVFIIGVHRFSPPMEKILANPLYILFFIPFTITAALNMITDSVFISYGKAVYSMIINIVMSFTKLGLALVFTGLGVMGIISSFSLSTILAMILSFVFLVWKCDYKIDFIINKEELSKLWRFSLGNYFSNILGSLTSLLTPLLITSRLSPQVTAYYYMPTMIVNLLLTVPRSSVSSLIAEGSREEESLSKLALRAFMHTYTILVPACIGILFLGNFILAAFGKNYSAEGFRYLQLVIIAILMSVPGFIGGAILNIRRQIKRMFFVNLISSFLSLGLNLLLLSKGLYGLGLSSIIYQVIITIVYAFAVLFRYETT